MNIVDVKEVKAYTKKKVLEKGKLVEKQVLCTVGIRVSFDDIRPELVGYDKVEQDKKEIAPHGTWVMYCPPRRIKDRNGKQVVIDGVEQWRPASYSIHTPSSPEYDPLSLDTDMWNRMVRGTGKVLLTNKRNQPICHTNKDKSYSLRQFKQWGLSAIVLAAIGAKLEEIEQERAERAAA